MNEQVASVGVGVGDANVDVDVDVRYLSVGANRHTAVADWSEDGIVAFGADCNVALWRPNVGFLFSFFNSPVSPLFYFSFFPTLTIMPACIRICISLPNTYEFLNISGCY